MQVISGAIKTVRNRHAEGVNQSHIPEWNAPEHVRIHLNELPGLSRSTKREDFYFFSPAGLFILREELCTAAVLMIFQTYSRRNVQRNTAIHQLFCVRKSSDGSRDDVTN